MRPGGPGRWSVPIDHIARQLSLRVETVARRITLGCVTDTIRRSPVDTGRFRGSYMYGYGTINFSLPGTYDKVGRVSELRVSLDYSKAEVAGIHNFSSSLHYAVGLENGNSLQAPHGMVRLAIIATIANINAIAAQARYDYPVR